MKRCILLPAFFFISFALEAQPVDITVGGGMDALSIDTKNLNSKYDLDSSAFAFIPFWYAKVGGEIGKKFRFEAEYRQDPFWQSTVSGSVGAIYKIINLGLGAQFGAHDYSSDDFSFDKAELWDVGITSYVKVEYPGVFFAGFDYLLDLKSSYQGYGKSERHYLAARGGFWLPHIFIKGAYSRKGYIESKIGGINIDAGEEQFDVNLEFFSKNIPFRISGGAGSLKLSTVVDNNEQKTTYWYTAAGLTFIFGGKLQFFMNGKIPFLELRAQLHKASAEAGFIWTILDAD
jgi:hypothetical protein